MTPDRPARTMLPIPDRHIIDPDERLRIVMATQ
jgi:hypothetical protein